MLEFKNVTFRYEGESENIIENLSFTLAEGEFVAIIGASGCGKSTIFRLINGLESNYSGEILINGKNIKGIKNYSAYMPQKDLLFPWRSIQANVSLPMEIQNKSKTETSQKAIEVLREVGLEDYKDKFPKDLSGGMRQRVSFARTLLAGGDLFLLDEPFSALDSLTRIELQEWLLQVWQKHNKTILFVTHDVEEALFLSKRIFIVKDRPISYLEEYEVPLAYPRKREDMKDEKVTELKEKLIKELRQKVKL